MPIFEETKRKDMKYRFLLNGNAIDRDGEEKARKFACSVPADTPVLVFEQAEDDQYKLTLIDRLRVCDIWDLPGDSYQDQLMRKMQKK